MKDVIGGESIEGGVLSQETKPQIEFLLRAVASATQSLLMLDYDGTLAPFRKDPAQAVPYPGIAPVLQEIVRSEKTRVVIISGRNPYEVIPLLNISPRPEVWGLQGLQRLNPDGTSQLGPLDPSTVAELAAAEDWLRYQHLEHAAEFKTGSIAMHWRGLDQCEAEAMRGRVLTGWSPLAKQTRLDLLEFDGGIEIRAHMSDKGAAVRTILSEVPSGTPVVYLGDDTPDEKAFQAVNGRGLSVLVNARRRKTAAQAWLKGPDEVLDLLQRWPLAGEREILSADTTVSVTA
jgi:trehalose 6-phosphate phosphatase